MYYEIAGTQVRIAGTMHLVPAGLPLAPWVDGAYDWAQSLVLEHDEALLPSIAFLPPPQTLQERLPPDVWAALQQVWPPNHPMGTLRSQRLWVALIGLSFIGVALSPGVEITYRQRAARDHKSIDYLEDTRDFGVVGNEIADAEYVGLFRQVLANRDNMQATLQRIYDAWMSHRPQEVQAVIPATLLCSRPAIRERLIDRRNQNWIPVIGRAAREKNERTLICMGALHLVGPGGVLALLEQAGYQLHPTA